MPRTITVGCGEWGFRHLPFAEHFPLAARLGFRCLEIGLGGGLPGRLPPRVDDALVAEVARLRAEHDLSTPFCCIENDLTLPDPQAHAAMVDEVAAQMTQAARLGCTHVRLFAGFTAYDAMTEAIWERLAAAFRALAVRAGELGLTIAIETHGAIAWREGVAHHTHTVTTHRAGLARLLAELPPQIGFNYDPGNIKAADPGDRRLALDLLDRRIVYCHLKDWMPRGSGFVPGAPGDGDLDYATLIPAMSYDGVYLVEYEPTADVEDGIRRSLAYLGGIVTTRFSGNA